MNDLKQRLTSRTFWIAVFTIGLFMLNEQYSEAAAVATAYIAGEKVVDTFGSRPVVVSPVQSAGSHNMEDDDIKVDPTKIETGKPGLLMFDEEEKED